MKHMKATYAIIALWCAVLLLTKTTGIMEALCGKGIDNINGEYYRFFTASFLHGGWLHFLVNAAAMFWAGHLYEKHMGSIHFLALAVASAAAAQAVFSLVFHASRSSFGGSVMVFALCGFGIIMSLIRPDFPKLRLGTWSGNWLALYLTAGNLPVLPFMNASTVAVHLMAFGTGAFAAALFC